jgi:hypothetical protein
MNVEQALHPAVSAPKLHPAERTQQILTEMNLWWVDDSTAQPGQNQNSVQREVSASPKWWGGRDFSLPCERNSTCVLKSLQVNSQAQFVDTDLAGVGSNYPPNCTNLRLPTCITCPRRRARATSRSDTGSPPTLTAPC